MSSHEPKGEESVGNTGKVLQDEEEFEDLLAQKTLMNEVILDGIFSQLNLEELKTIRQVCSKWYYTSYKFMAKQGAIIFPLYDFSTSNTIHEILDSEGRLPCSCVRVIDPPLNKDSIFGKFVKKFGEEVKELELETITISRSEFNYFQKIIFENLHLLETLSFTAIQVKEPEEKEPKELDSVPEKCYLRSLKRIQCVQRPSTANSVLNESFLRNIFERSPNLGEIKANNASFVKNMLENSPQRTIANIQCISFVHDKKSGDTLAQLKELSKKGLRLQSFEWEDTRKRPDFKKLAEFLDIQKSSLKNFSLTISQYNIKIPELPSLPPLPVMEKLEFLQLSSISPIFFQQKNWTAQFPALEAFHYFTLHKYPLKGLLELLRMEECSPLLKLNLIKVSSFHEIDVEALKNVSKLSYNAFPSLSTFIYRFRNKEIIFSHKDLLRYFSKKLPQSQTQRGITIV